jgi:phosphate starvation-inducible protein PhoH and related proteins
MALKREKKVDSDKIIKPKFAVVRQENITPLVPLNPLQATYINFINTKKVIIATGYPGTSKTYIPTVMACDMWRKGEITRIFLTRPNVSNSKSLGYFSGSIVEKMTNWLLPVLDIMNKRLGKAVVEIAIKTGDISFIPLETIKGMSFGPDTFVICDEAEDIDVEMSKILLTRMGGGIMVLCGDIEQSALRGNSGLAKIKQMVEKYPQLEQCTGLVDFNRPSDIVRSPECKEWILAFRKEEV